MSRGTFLRTSVAVGASTAFLQACSAGSTLNSLAPAAGSSPGGGASVVSRGTSVSIIDSASGRLLVSANVASVANDVLVTAKTQDRSVPLTFSLNASRAGSLSLGQGVVLSFSAVSAAFSGPNGFVGELHTVGDQIEFNVPSVGYNGVRTPMTKNFATDGTTSKSLTVTPCSVLNNAYAWAMAGYIVAAAAWVAEPLDPLAAAACVLAAADVQNILNEEHADGC